MTRMGGYLLGPLGVMLLTSMGCSHAFMGVDRSGVAFPPIQKVQPWRDHHHRSSFSRTPSWTLAPCQDHRRLSTVALRSSSSSSSESFDSTDTSSWYPGINVKDDERLYQVRLSRSAGIDWGTDLSFAFVYVRDLDPSGEAAIKNVQIGDQLCQITPVLSPKNSNDDDDENTTTNHHENDGPDHTVNPRPMNVMGASFDYVMSCFTSLDRSIQKVDLIFFRGTRDELKAAGRAGLDSVSAAPTTVTVTVKQRPTANNPSPPVTTLHAPAGVNLRQLCVDNGINVYQSVTRWTNCKGKQLCGTCIVNVTDGAENTNRKSIDEASTLRENPDSYRLSCITFVYGDCTVETFPPVQPTQWTR